MLGKVIAYIKEYFVPTSETKIPLWCRYLLYLGTLYLLVQLIIVIDKTQKTNAIVVILIACLFFSILCCMKTTRLFNEDLIRSKLLYKKEYKELNNKLFYESYMYDTEGIISDFLRDNSLDPIKIEYTVDYNGGAMIAGSYNIRKKQICITKEKVSFNKNNFLYLACVMHELGHYKDLYKINKISCISGYKKANKDAFLLYKLCGLTTTFISFLNTKFNMVSLTTFFIANFCCLFLLLPSLWYAYIIYNCKDRQIGLNVLLPNEAKASESALEHLKEYLSEREIDMIREYYRCCLDTYIFGMHFSYDDFTNPFIKENKN